eukprot:6356283-Amphidinium_carterae.1
MVVPPGTIRMIVCKLAPVSLSWPNLRSSLKKGQREISRETALQLLEFLTGTLPTEVVGEVRDLPSLTQ